MAYQYFALEPTLLIYAGTITHRCTPSELEAVVLAPFLHYLHKVLHLGVVRVLEQLDHFDQSLLVLLASDHHLEHSDCRTSLSFPKLRVWVQSLEHIKSLN